MIKKNGLLIWITIIGVIINLISCAHTTKTKLPEVIKKDEPSNPEIQGNITDDKVLDKNNEGLVKLYKKAAEQGFAQAQCDLGVCYMSGNGIEKNPEEGVRWYKKAAEQGFTLAQYNLGVCYMSGNGIEKNLEEAAKWYKKAAEQGFAQAQYNLGMCYEKGEGVEKNPEEAVKWYKKAVEQEDPKAIEALKELQNTIEKIPELQQKAETGDPEAQYRLGIHYYDGSGVSEDKKVALEWLRRAAAQGHKKAINLLEILDKK